MSPVAPAPVSPAELDARGQKNQIIPFRQATQERVEILPTTAPAAITAGAQRSEVPLDGVGYLYAVLMNLVATAATNSAIVAYTEDAPWNAYDTVVLRDVNGELTNVTGFGLYLANLINHDYATRLWDASGNINLFQAIGGGVAAGGSFTSTLRVPVGLNRRDLLAIVGNQDRSQTYLLRHDIAASATIYATAPTNAATLTLNKFMEAYMVPQAQSQYGQQEIYPPGYGTLRYLTETVSDVSPQPGQQNHYLRRIGQTIRWIALTFRAVGVSSTIPRASVMGAAVMPSNVRFKVGDETLFNESFTYRRALMFERYGFEFPDGVLVYETLHDFIGGAQAAEMGDDWWHTALITNAQFQITYPAGFTANAANSLTFTTDDMVLRGR